MSRRLCCQADGQGILNSTRGRTYIKRQKRRRERQAAKRDPECQALYTRYNGYFS